MSSSTVENVVIVGTGCAGLTAAIYTARANLSPLVIEGSLPGGQLTTTSEVENFPGFPEGVDGFQLMDNLRKQAAKFGARFEQAQVQSVDFTSSPRKLVCAGRTILAKEGVIISTGASPRMTGIPGEKGTLRRQGRDHVRDLRRRVLSQDGRRSDRRRRQRRGRGPFSHAFCQQGLPGAPPRLAARLEDYG